MCILTRRFVPPPSIAQHQLDQKTATTAWTLAPVPSTSPEPANRSRTLWPAECLPARHVLCTAIGDHNVFRRGSLTP
jgi:hypothetical protein